MKFLPTPDLPFSKEDANRYLPAVIAVMTALTAFILAFGISVGNIIIDKQSDLEYRAQIHLPYDDGREVIKAANLLKILKKDDGIIHAEIITSDKIKNILSPWIGHGDAIDILPIPAVIDVWLDPIYADKGKITAKHIKQKYLVKYKGAIIDDYHKWLADFIQLIKNAEFIFYSLASLILISAIIVVLLIARTSVQLHFPIVKLLYRIGAEESYIARQFQFNAMLQVIKGGIIGVIVAIILFTITRNYLLNNEIISSIATIGEVAQIFVIIPILMAIIVGLSARFAVRQMIHKIYMGSIN